MKNQAIFSYQLNRFHLIVNLQYFYDQGIGSRKSAGFGMIDLITQDPTIESVKLI